MNNHLILKIQGITVRIKPFDDLNRFFRRVLKINKSKIFSADVPFFLKHGIANPAIKPFPVALADQDYRKPFAFACLYNGNGFRYFIKSTKPARQSNEAWAYFKNITLRTKKY